MGALIQFKIGREGGLVLAIHKDLWRELCDVDRASVTEDGEFIRIPLEGMTQERLKALTGTPGSDQEPCKPVVQFDLIL